MNEPTPPTLYTARWVLPITAPAIEAGAVLVEGHEIVSVGTESDVRRGLETRTHATVELGQAALLPGLINVHTHIELTLLRTLCEQTEFFPWIRHLTEVKYNHVEDDAYRVSAQWGALEALQSGITTVGDASDRGVVLEALKLSGLRGIAYQEVFGPDPHDAEGRAAELEDKVLALIPQSTDRVKVGVSPHAPYTVSSPLFRKTVELARNRSLPVCTHIAESAAEVSFLREGTGPFAEYLRGRGIPVVPARVSPIAYLHDLGVLEGRPLLVHVVQAERRDVELLQELGVPVAHCPKSNAKLGHGTAPLAEFLDAGIEIGLGTDGAVSTNSHDLLEEARFACLAQRGRRDLQPASRERLTAEALLRLATLGGAAALNMDDLIGSLEPGKRADLIAVDLSGPRLQPVYDAAAALLFGASGRDVVLTVVDGEVLYREGRTLTLDEAALAREVEIHRVRIEERATG